MWLLMHNLHAAAQQVELYVAALGFNSDTLILDSYYTLTRHDEGEISKNTFDVQMAPLLNSHVTSEVW